VRAAVVLRRHFDVVVVPSAIGFLVLNAEVREMDLLIEVREVVFECPVTDLFRCAIGMPIVVVAVPIPFVEPLLVVALELVVEQHAIDTRAALVKAFRFTLVGAIDLDVVLQFRFAFQTRVERLLMAMVAVTVAVQEIPSFLREYDRVFAIARHAHRLNQPLFAEMPQVAGSRIGGFITMVRQVTTRDNSKRTNGRERARFRSTQGVLTIAVADDLPLESAREIEIPRENVTGFDVALATITVAFRPARVIVAIAGVLV
jgi:hypothetical protein